MDEEACFAELFGRGGLHVGALPDKVLGDVGFGGEPVWRGGEEGAAEGGEELFDGFMPFGDEESCVGSRFFSF